MVSPGIVSTAIGGRLGTVTRKLCIAARPPGSVAVTVTVTSPFAVATTVTTAPATDTSATALSDTVAA